MRLGDFSLHDAEGRARVKAGCAAVGLSDGLWNAVLEARASHRGASNRRGLYAAFDGLFGGSGDVSAAPGSDQCADPVDGDASGTVTLTRLVLKNWKVFHNADFTFPDYDPARPVVLIGGKNGYGKTSFLEGLLYGLFGREALLDLHEPGAAAPASGAARGQAYRRAMERALHRPALDRGDGVMSVRSEWRIDEAVFVVERRWYFDEAGRLVEDDEAVNLWTGADLDVLPAPEGEDPSLFYQAEIARRLMAPSLAAFVLFDGEQVKRFAQRDFAGQVRLAVETVLGLSVWREAIADLRAYARDRARGAIKGDDEAVLEDLAGLERREHDLQAQIAALGAVAAPLRTQRDEVLERLGALNGRTYASMQNLLERRQATQAELTRARHDFSAAVSGDLPLALVGGRLRGILKASLEGDRASQDGGALWAQPAALEQLVVAVEGQLTDLQDRETVLAALRRAWTALSHSESDPPRHGYLSGSIREMALARLAAEPGRTIAAPAQRIAQLTAELESLDADIAAREATDQDVQVLRGQLERLSGQLQQHDGVQRALDQALGQACVALSEARQAAEARLVARMSDAQMVVRRERALACAEGGVRLIAHLTPACFDAVGKAVTSAYRALAHKGLVDHIRIEPDGAVVLIDGTGTDVRTIEASAGESQIFAMALMAAVARLSGRRLPSIIDTPLGRLDPDHRLRVLTFFTRQDVQTVLLSQPDEVNQHYFDLIADRIAAQFHLDHVLASGGVGGSVPLSGYFPGMAA
ncbi:AAA family ATPase [Brevundimonas sp.]|uniref:AAA family ATPase n=1 Tax=Brevundimonas sp. TaxID=1871086 RepID=UPI003D6CCCFD